MPKRPSSEARVRPMSDVEARPVEWLWPGWIPLGKLTVLDGDPGMGKSTLLLDLAARLSRDGVMPDGAVGPVGASLILSAEDAEEDTIKPRLAAAGGVAGRLFTLSAVNGEERAPEVPLDLPAIEAAVAERGARLLIIDPLMAYLTGVDASRDQDVRRALFRLARLAERRNCAVVCLRHLSKIGGDKAIYRGGGSIGIVAAARTGLLTAADPDDAALRVLAATKCNLAAAPRPLCFRLEPCGDVCRVAWLGQADYTADELVRRLSRAELAERAEERTRLEEAVAFLRNLLEDGPQPTSQCYTLAQIEGIARRTLQRALKPAGVRQRRTPGASDPVWELDPCEDGKT
jgi:AAA domain